MLENTYPNAIMEQSDYLYQKKLMTDCGMTVSSVKLLFNMTNTEFKHYERGRAKLPIKIKLAMEESRDKKSQAKEKTE